MARIPGLQYNVGGSLGRHDVNAPVREAAAKGAVIGAATKAVQTVADIGLKSETNKAEAQARQNNAKMAVWQKNFSKEYGGQDFIDGEPASDVVPKLYEEQVMTNINKQAENITNPVARANWLQEAKAQADKNIEAQFIAANTQREKETQNMDDVTGQVLLDNELYEPYHEHIDNMNRDQSFKESAHLKAQITEVGALVDNALENENIDALKSLKKDFQADRFDRYMPKAADRAGQVNVINAAIKRLEEKNKAEDIAIAGDKVAMSAVAAHGDDEAAAVKQARETKDVLVKDNAVMRVQNFYAEKRTAKTSQNYWEKEQIDEQLEQRPDFIDASAITDEHLKKYVEVATAARAKGVPIPTDLDAYAEISRQMATNPAEFARQDLTEVAPWLSSSDYKSFLNLQQKVKADINNPDFQNYLTGHKAAMNSLGAMGLDGKKLGEKNTSAQPVNQAYNELIKAMNRKQRELGRDLSDTEMLQVGADFARAVKTEGSLFGYGLIDWNTEYSIKEMDNDQAKYIDTASSVLGFMGYDVTSGTIGAAARVLKAADEATKDMTDNQADEWLKRNFIPNMNGLGVPPPTRAQ